MKQYHIVSRIAIYMLAVVMISFGLYHFQNARDLIVYIPSSVPGGIVWVYFVGGAFILVGLAFIFNKMVKAAAYLLTLLLLIFIVIIHIPNYLEAGDKEMRSVAFINILKDLAIAGFALHIDAGAHHQKLHLEDSD
jgi:putative oxidoreductase